MTSKPEIHHTEITPNDRFLVLATDGLWEFMSSQEVVDIVSRHQGNPAAGKAPDPRAAIVELIAESNRRWRKEEPVIDDTTIVVAFFK